MFQKLPWVSFLLFASSIIYFSATAKIWAQNSVLNNGQKLNAATTIVAKVGKETIFLSEIQQMAHRLPDQIKKMPMQQVYPSLLARAIDSKLISIAARKAGFANHPETKKRLMSLENQIISEIFLTESIGGQVTEESLRSIYERTKTQMGGREEVRARHILLDTKEQAIEMIKKLQDGDDFSKLAMEYSSGPSAPSGGDLGWFDKKQMVPEFAEAAFSMAIGDITTGPVKTQFGWHVIKVEDRKISEPPTFEEAREKLAEQMAQGLLKDLITKLHNSVKIERFNFDGSSLRPSKTK